MSELLQFKDKLSNGIDFTWGFRIDPIPDCCTMNFINSLFFQYNGDPATAIEKKHPYADFLTKTFPDRVSFGHNSGSLITPDNEKFVNEIYRTITKFFLSPYQERSNYAKAHIQPSKRSTCIALSTKTYYLTSNIAGNGTDRRAGFHDYAVHSKFWHVQDLFTPIKGLEAGYRPYMLLCGLNRQGITNDWYKTNILDKPEVF